MATSGRQPGSFCTIIWRGRGTLLTQLAQAVRFFSAPRRGVAAVWLTQGQSTLGSSRLCALYPARPAPGSSISVEATQKLPLTSEPQRHPLTRPQVLKPPISRELPPSYDTAAVLRRATEEPGWVSPLVPAARTESTCLSVKPHGAGGHRYHGARLYRPVLQPRSKISPCLRVQRQGNGRGDL